MTYLILFDDNPDADPALRRRHMPQHLAFLTAQEGRIESAGPLFDEQDAGQGGAWVVDVDTVDEARALVQADPFWPTGLRARVTILRWHRVFAGGQPTGV